MAREPSHKDEQQPPERGPQPGTGIYIGRSSKGNTIENATVKGYGVGVQMEREENRIGKLYASRGEVEYAA